ncbi:MAG: aspartate carbamoyltransferase [Gammaproteobacteria bacterium]|nr:aspartate carbamoyltransferase [Gammaproteobacteria bacterium]
MRESMIPGRGAATVAALAVLGCAAPEPSADLAARRAAVAAAGSRVMPFDLDATVHVFEKTGFGGIQQVVAETGDPRQIALIREHLELEAGRFARGDFHDPAMVHGPEMAGLHRLVMGHERLSVEYGEIDRGAEIVYRSEDPSLVAAIHAWFDAQLRDHGEHARAHRR